MNELHPNIILSLATVAILLTAALAGWLSLTTGLLLNEATALLIIANGLRLARTPRPARRATRLGLRGSLEPRSAPAAPALRRRVPYGR